jgi:hypothetical protein
MTKSPLWWAICRISFIAAGTPNGCTTRIALVRRVMTCSTRPGVQVQSTWIDIGENGHDMLIAECVCDSDERKRWQDDLVCLPDAQRANCEMRDEALP